jgi:hypothetical protein
MPNFCECELLIKASDKSGEKKLSEFVQQAVGEDCGASQCLDFNKFVPYPDEFKSKDIAVRQWELDHPDNREGRPTDGFNSGGYEWRLQNWGTKWNASCPKLVRKSKRKVEYRFDTPWSPPLGVIDKMAALYPELSFQINYWEAGCGFQGEAFWENGEQVYDESMEYTGGRGG